METAVIKNLSESLRQLAADLKRLRAAQQILDGYIRLNSSIDGIDAAINQLQASADEITRHSRQFAKVVSDLSSAVTTTLTTTTEEM